MKSTVCRGNEGMATRGQSLDEGAVPADAQPKQPILHEVLPSYARRTALSMWLVRFHPLLQLLLLLSQERDAPGCSCT